ncbi:hypothetical protein KY289_008243 [Solanum tuberosum]|nr:hypothetical protein KY289_008243 [Solanum tuberosum]
MLGQPWQFNRKAIHDRRNNRVSLELNKIKYTLAPSTPTQVYEDQKRVKEAMKKFEREKSERRKGVHSDIPRKEKGELVLCEENGMSIEKKSENERKEKRDDHESKKEKDDSVVEREKQESLSEVISYSNSSIPTSSSCFDSLADTHGKVCIEKSKSLDELNSKVVDTTSPIEKLYVDENDKGKKNYFGYVQGKAHNKTFNKAIVDLTPMRKEK